MNKRDFTLAEIRAGYTAEKRKEDREFRVWLYLVLRKISFYVAWVCLKFGISANQTTFLSVIVGFSGCILIASGQYYDVIAGSILINCWLLLDCVDGDIARTKGSTSHYGQFVDALAGYLVSGLVFASIGIGCVSGISCITSCNGLLILGLGFWGSLSYVLTKLISLQYKYLLSHTSTVSAQGHNSVSKIAFLIFRNVYGVSGVFCPLLLLAAIFRFLDLFIIFYATVNAVALLFISAWTVYKGKAL